MYNYPITFKAINHSIVLCIKASNQKDGEGIRNPIILIFSEIDQNSKSVSLKLLQQNSPELLTKISKFVGIAASQVPLINALLAFFTKLKKDEYFYILPNVDKDYLDNNDTLELNNNLIAINEGKNIEELNNQTSDLHDLFTKYSCNSFGTIRVHIGEKDKAKRVCRFCNNNRKPVQFKSVAHAISEALGNKTIILYEECDQCNDHFSRTIEPDMIQYLSLFRTIYNIKGKGGSKKIKGKNFNLWYDGSVILSHQSNNEKPKESNIIPNYDLKFSDGITLQNIYKGLCKYFLSVIDSSELSHFSDTINWINGDKIVERLPLIAEKISYHSFSEQPKLSTYLRKTNDESIPYAVGEFCFTCRIFVFIIPFTSNGIMTFLNKDEYDVFWNTFQHYKKLDGWKFMDYSDNIKKELTINLNFILDKNAK